MKITRSKVTKREVTVEYNVSSKLHITMELIFDGAWEIHFSNQVSSIGLDFVAEIVQLLFKEHEDISSIYIKKLVNNQYKDLCSFTRTKENLLSDYQTQAIKNTTLFL